MSEHGPGKAPAWACTYQLDVLLGSAMACDDCAAPLLPLEVVVWRTPRRARVAFPLCRGCAEHALAEVQRRLRLAELPTQPPGDDTDTDTDS